MQVKQVFTASGYEKMVLSMNEWMAEQGYAPFAHVVEVSPKRYQLNLLTDADGVPRTPEVEAVVEFLKQLCTNG